MSILRIAFLTFAAAIASSIASTSANAQTATVREERVSFRTYPFGDPNPVARTSNIYPYFRFEGYSATPVMKDWKIVTLENPYVKVLIAPEIGGKILGAFEKTTGKPFIYFNKVVKFREIAMRGPWTSGGIEFNFGDVGHAPSTATPVDYTTRINPDGSASCIVGTIDLPSRTEWRVEIRLPKDKAYFETCSFWYNPTELPTSLYHWMNAAADADSDLFFIYPGTAHIDHGGISSPWPIDRQGRDLSLYRNNAFGPSKSYHVLGVYTDFFGVGWKNRDFGVIHWADYVDKPGKKLWLWALSREGGIWTNLLTDTDLGNSQYIEFQSGLLFNQALPGSTLTPFKHRTFGPFSEERFTEAWFPFKGIGGVVKADPHALLNAKRKASTVVFGICPLERVREDLVAYAGSREIYRKPLSLKPMQAYFDSVALPEDSDYTIRLGSLLVYRSSDDKSHELERPREANKDFDWHSADGLIVDAVEHGRQRDYSGALARYQASLAIDPLYNPALVGIAEIYYRRMEYALALSYIRKALANDAYDPAANFLYGVIQRHAGKLFDAIDGFGTAARSAEYRSAANTALAEVACLQQEWQNALLYADRALDYDRYNVRALRVRTVAFRKLGQRENAERAVESILALDPLAHFARMERYLLRPNDEARKAFVSGIHTELPAEVYLELATYYYDIGLYKDALQSLAFAPAHPIICFWKAYLSEKVGNRQDAQAWLRKGTECSPSLIFPFRSETEDVLSWAQLFSDHWTIRYYASLVLWSTGRLDDARRSSIACANIPTYAPFYITRGNLFRDVNDSIALYDFRRAVTLGADDWRAYSALASFFNDHAQYGDALKILQSGTTRFPASYVLLFDYAHSLLFNRQYRECLTVLDTITVLPFEGAGYGRDLHRQAAILASVVAMRQGKHQEALGLIAKAREWPERLGVGKPYEVDCRIEDYLEALCRAQAGDSASAIALYRGVIEHTSAQDVRDAQYLLSLLALQKLGQSAEATRTVDAWASSEPDNPVAKWAAKTIHGKSSKAKEPGGVKDNVTTGQWNPIPSDQSFPMVSQIASLSLE